jgi:hypothetical protein
MGLRKSYLLPTSAWSQRSEARKKQIRRTKKSAGSSTSAKDGIWQLAQRASGGGFLSHKLATVGGVSLE